MFFVGNIYRAIATCGDQDKRIPRPGRSSLRIPRLTRAGKDYVSQVRAVILTGTVQRKEP